MSRRNYECVVTCCHFRPGFNHCKFWLDYLSGFCDKISLEENIEKFCPLKTGQNDFQKN